MTRSLLTMVRRHTSASGNSTSGSDSAAENPAELPLFSSPEDMFNKVGVGEGENTGELGPTTDRVLTICWLNLFNAVAVCGRRAVEVGPVCHVCPGLSRQASLPALPCLPCLPYLDPHSNSHAASEWLALKNPYQSQ